MFNFLKDFYVISWFYDLYYKYFIIVTAGFLLYTDKTEEQNFPPQHVSSRKPFDDVTDDVTAWVGVEDYKFEK